MFDWESEENRKYRTLSDYGKDNAEQARRLAGICPNYRKPFGKRYLKYSFNDRFYTELHDTEILNARQRLTAWIDKTLSQEHEDARGFYIFSDVGRCKTALMACTYKELIARGIPTGCTTVDNLFKLYESDRQEDLSCLRYMRDDLLVLMIDDIGIESLNGSFQDKERNTFLKDFLDARLNNETITCFTSNFSPKGLEDKGFLRQSVDRIREMTTGNLILIKGESVRCNESLAEIQRISRKESEDESRERD